MKEICERAADRDVVVGAYVDDPSMTRRWIDAGIQYVMVKADDERLTDVTESIDR